MAEVLVTGSSRGIGLALVRSLAMRGDRVIATCRRPGEASELQALANQHNTAAILTTLKDLVKINQTCLGTQPLWAVDIQTQILNGEQPLQLALEQIRQRVDIP